MVDEQVQGQRGGDIESGKPGEKLGCERLVSRVSGAALNSGVNWPWSGERVMRVKRWESKVLRLTLRPKMKASEGWVDYKKSTLKEMRTKWRKLKLPTMAEKNAEKWLGPSTMEEQSMMPLSVRFAGLWFSPPRQAHEDHSFACQCVCECSSTFSPSHFVR